MTAVLTAPAHADEGRLTWDVPAECGTRDAFERSVARLLGRPVDGALPVDRAFVALIALCHGCYLFHGLDGEESHDVGDAGDPESGRDDTVPPDPECPEPLRLRLDGDTERAAVRSLPGYHTGTPSAFLDLAVDDGSVSLLMATGVRTYTVVTLEPEARRLPATASPDGAPGTGAFVRGGALLNRGPHPSALVLWVGDADHAIVHSIEPVLLEWPVEADPPDELVLPPLESECNQCVAPVVGGPDRLHVVRPGERLFEIARVDLDAMTVTAVEHDAPPRHRFAVPALAAAELSGTIAVTGGSGHFTAIPAFGVLLGPDGTARDVTIPGSLADPAPVVASDPSRGQFVWARHVTRSDDTFDASVYLWAVDPAGAAGPRVRVPTPGGSALLSMSATASGANGPVLAWTDRVPGSLTDSRVWLLPQLPEVDRCAEVTATPIATIREGARIPEVRAIAHDGAYYVFYVEDRSPSLTGDPLLAVDRVECDLRPLDP